MVRGPFKGQVLSMLRQRGIPIGSVLDVGVQVATRELIEAFPDLTHVLFEPVVEFNDSIKHNYRSVPHKLVNAAVSERSGEVSLQVFTVHSGMQISHSTMAKDSNASGLRTVPMVSLDDYLIANPEPGPYLLKIDVDGAEMSVLAGAAETLKKCSVVIIEAPRYFLIERVSALKAAGFDLVDLIEPCYYDDVIWQWDAVMIRSELVAKHFTRLSNTDFDASKYSTFRG